MIVTAQLTRLRERDDLKRRFAAMQDAEPLILAYGESLERISGRTNYVYTAVNDLAAPNLAPHQ
jgi:hypothetical protein